MRSYKLHLFCDKVTIIETDDQISDLFYKAMNKIVSGVFFDGKTTQKDSA